VDDRSGVSIGIVRDFVFSNDGRMYVLDAADYDVKVFDAAGHFSQRFGRRGGGPGEFATPSSIWISDTTVRVRDLANGTQVYSLSGAYLVTLPREQVELETRNLRFGMTLSVVEAEITGWRFRGRPPESVSRNKLVVVHRSGGQADTLGRIPVDWAFFESPSRSGSMRSSGFGDGGAWGLLGDSTVVVVDGYSGIVRWHTITQTGPRLSREVSLRVPAPRVTADDISAMERTRAGTAWTTGGGGTRQSVVAPVHVVGAPALWSVATKVFVAETGTLWVGAPRVELSNTGAGPVSQVVTNNLWTVIPASGEPFAVTFPKDFSAHAARGDRIVGLLLGEPGIQAYRVK
jgi:hypothetical protein